MRRPASILRSLRGGAAARSHVRQVGCVLGLAAGAALCAAVVTRRRHRGRRDDLSDAATFASGGAAGGDGRVVRADVAEGPPEGDPRDESPDADVLDQRGSANGAFPGERRSPLEPSGAVADPRLEAAEADLLENQPVLDEEAEPELPETGPESGSEADVLEQLRSEPLDEEDRR